LLNSFLLLLPAGDCYVQVRWRLFWCNCCVVFSICTTTGSFTVISKPPTFYSATRAFSRSVAVPCSRVNCLFNCCSANKWLVT